MLTSLSHSVCRCPGTGRKCGSRWSVRGRFPPAAPVETPSQMMTDSSFLCRLEPGLRLLLSHNHSTLRVSASELAETVLSAGLWCRLAPCAWKEGWRTRFASSSRAIKTPTTSWTEEPNPSSSSTLWDQVLSFWVDSSVHFTHFNLTEFNSPQDGTDATSLLHGDVQRRGHGLQHQEADLRAVPVPRGGKKCDPPTNEWHLRQANQQHVGCYKRRRSVWVRRAYKMFWLISLFLFDFSHCKYFSVEKEDILN